MVPRGVQQFLTVAPKYLRKTDSVEDKSSPRGSSYDFGDEILTIREEDLEGIYLKSLGVEVLQQNEDGKQFENQEESESMERDDHSIKPSHKPLDADVAKSIACSLRMDSSTKPKPFVDDSVIINQSKPQNPAISTSTTVTPPIPVLRQPSKDVLKKPLSTKKPVSVRLLRENKTTCLG